MLPFIFCLNTYQGDRSFFLFYLFSNETIIYKLLCDTLQEQERSPDGSIWRNETENTENRNCQVRTHYIPRLTSLVSFVWAWLAQLMGYISDYHSLGFRV